MTYEEYLEEKFMEEREIGGIPITKDNYESLYETWIEKLDPQEFIDYAEQWHTKI